jgi:hypothetical protein
MTHILKPVVYMTQTEACTVAIYEGTILAKLYRTTEHLQREVKKKLKKDFNNSAKIIRQYTQTLQ